MHKNLLWELHKIMVLKVFKKINPVSSYFSVLIKAFYLLMVLLYIYSSNWEVDPIHDGLTFPAAVAVSEGKVIFLDVNSQYGLLQPKIEGFILARIGPYLLLQRLVGSICIILISILIILCTKNLTRLNPYIPAIVYIALTPNWNNIPSVEAPLTRNTWSNSYGILFQMMCIYFFILYRKKLKNYLLLLSGIALGISALARIQFTIISLLILIFLVFLIKVEKNLNYVWMISGYCCIFVISLISLIHQGAAGPMYDQIIGALFDEGTNSVRVSPIPLALKTLLANITILVIYVSIGKLIRNKNLFFCFLYFLIIALTYFVYPRATEYQGKVFSFIKLLSENIVLSPIYFLVAACTIITSKQLFSAIKNKIFRKKLVRSDSIYLLICAMSYFNLIQMHILSPAYFYLILPTYLVLYFSYHTENLRSYFRSRNFKLVDQSSFSVLLPLVVCLSLTNYFFTLSKASSYYSAPILKHMKSYNPSVYSTVNDVTLAVSKLPIGSTVSVNCQYGLYSINQNGYLSNSRYQWNHLPKKLDMDKVRKETSLPSDYLVNCGNFLPKVEYFTYNQYRFTEIYRVRINKDELLTINKKSN
jgi:hypothetical protein